MGLLGRFGRIWERIEGQRERMKPSPFSGQIDGAGGSPASASAESAAPSPPPTAGSPGDVQRRAVISAPRLREAVAEVATTDDGAILVKAEVAQSGDECRFLANRAILAGFSWWYPEASAAEDSPLVAALFALEGVASVLVDDTTLTITRSGEGDWRPLAEQVGEVMRAQLTSDVAPVGPSVIDALPDPDDVEACAQAVIETVINPGVAAHSGHIRLLEVRGNSVTIEMGGGCQGCSAADVTLKQGIHEAFRDAMPGIGGIYDDTDHAAGLNPFFK